MLKFQDKLVPCRGREDRLATNPCDTFSTRQLDELAPLEPHDASELGDYCTPSSETITRVQKRIEAARRLKYGR